MLNVLIWSIF